jgi:glycosyl-4,4'-diaponeurosporenoate acyltransferase
MKFTACALYLASIGIFSHFVGQTIPRSWFDSDRFPFRVMNWERGGAVYERLKIKFWKDKLPDMSKILSDMVPKRISRQASRDEAELLIQEACIAEWIHILLSIAGLLCLFIWPGTGGIVITLVWILLGNLPFILIQRYNRPRLKKLANRLAGKRHVEISTPERNELDESPDLDLQYR